MLLLLLLLLLVSLRTARVVGGGVMTYTMVLGFGKVKELLEYGRQEERVSRFVRATCLDDSLLFFSLFHSRSVSLALAFSEGWIAIT